VFGRAGTGVVRTHCDVSRDWPRLSRHRWWRKAVESTRDDRFDPRGDCAVRASSATQS